MQIAKPLIAHTAMLIRRPPADCFEAFVDPHITSNFWFTHGSARLDRSREVTWAWAMYGMSSKVAVKEVMPHARIVVEWNHDTDRYITVEWTFTERPDGSTFIDIRDFGFKGDAENQLEQLVDTVGGFSFVLAGAKAWLEHGIRLGMIEDRHPDRHIAGWNA